MWAVCYSVGNTVLMVGKVISESNGTIIVEDQDRETWKQSGWDAWYVDKVENEDEAQKKLQAIYRHI